MHGEIPNQGYGQNRGRSPPSNRDDRHKYYDEPQSPHPRATHYRGDPGLDVPAVSSTAVNVLMELSQVLRYFSIVLYLPTYISSQNQQCDAKKFG